MSSNLSEPSVQTLPPLYRLDAGLPYTRTWGGLTVKARLDLINAIDRPNGFDGSLCPTRDGYAMAARTMPGRRPVLPVSVGDRWATTGGDNAPFTSER